MESRGFVQRNLLLKQNVVVSQMQEAVSQRVDFKQRSTQERTAESPESHCRTRSVIQEDEKCKLGQRAPAELGDVRRQQQTIISQG